MVGEEHTKWYRALTKKDPKLCDALKEPKFANLCSDEINWQAFLMTGDAKICENMRSETYRNQCRSSVAAKTDLEYVRKVGESGDAALCEKVQIPSNKISCLDLAFLRTALSSANVSICAQISDSQKRSDCEKAVSLVSTQK